MGVLRGGRKLQVLGFVTIDQDLGSVRGPLEVAWPDLYGVGAVAQAVLEASVGGLTGIGSDLPGEPLACDRFSIDEANFGWSWNVLLFLFIEPTHLSSNGEGDASLNGAVVNFGGNNADKLLLGNRSFGVVKVVVVGRYQL